MKAATGARMPAAPAPLSRRERKKERTRQEIYHAALDLFGQGGYDAVSIEAICEAADVARGTFFLHFPSKAELLYEFDRIMAEELSTKLARKPASAADELRALCEMLSTRWIADAEIMGPMLREFIANPETAARAEDRDLGVAALIEGIVERGQASGELRSTVRPRLAVAVFLSTSAAILSGSVFPPGETSPAKIREQFLEVMLHGLGHNPE